MGGLIMKANIDKIEEIVNNKNKIIFKLYGVNYTIEKNEDKYYIYQTLNRLRQKQLLTIARAILSYKPFTILDEATSSVGTRT